MAEAVAAARAFVERHGEALDVRILDALCDVAGGAALARALAERQGEDGSIRALPGCDEGPVGATARALEVLDAARLLDGVLVERAVGFLAGAQASDGSWVDASDVSAQDRLARTAQVASLLARTPFARLSALRAAEAWLRARWSVDLVSGPAYGPVLAYLRVLANLDSDLGDAVLQWCGRELERGFRGQAFGPVATARILLRCGARALPGARLTAAEVVEALLAAQEPDGGFPGARLRDRVDETREAAVALLRLSA